MITLFSHTAGGRLAASPKSNLDNLLPALDKGGEPRWIWPIWWLQLVGCYLLCKIGFQMAFVERFLCCSDTAEVRWVVFGVFLGYMWIWSADFPAPSGSVTGACEPQTLWPQDPDLWPLMTCWPNFQHGHPSSNPLRLFLFPLLHLLCIFCHSRSLHLSLSVCVLRGSGHSANECSYLEPGP